MTWCWLIGHSFKNYLGRNMAGRPVYACTRCMKRRTTLR